MTTEYRTTTYRIAIDYDYDAEDPTDFGPFRFISFNNRHNNYEHPDTITDTDIIATLSCYEHGLCKWMIGPSTVPDPYGGFDTVNVAGVVVWTDEDTSGETDEHNRQWWADMGEDQRAAYLKELADIYTEWVNGNNYRYSIVVMGMCDMGHEHPETTIDSCGGWIGMDHLADGLRDAMPDDLDPDTVQWAGEAGDIGTHLNLEREQ